MSLEKEIESAAIQVSTDAFSLTIGELVNMYRDGDIKIDPDFQRLFRWEKDRKSRLIESLLVRIPLPSIFVFELPNSKWEVIDGLQRLSTILEFMGVLKDPDTGEEVTPEALIGTQYLPSLDGAFWSEELMKKKLAEDGGRIDEISYRTEKYYAVNADVQRSIKRSKIGVQLLEKKSDPKSKFDLFQRLNSGGLSANDQELRNCAIVMVNKVFFDKFKDYAENGNISILIPLGPTSIRKSNHLDNLSKIFAFAFVDYTIGTDIEEFVTNALVNIASRDADEADKMLSIVTEGIDLLISACGVNALRPYNDGVFSGRIGRTSIEIILVGILRCLDNIKSKADPLAFVRLKVEEFWQSEEARKFSAAGIAGTDRVRYTVPRGVELFSA